MLAPAPQAPLSWAALTAFPGQADAYLKDHFGLRQTMIHTQRDLSHPVLYGNEIGAHRPRRPHVLSWPGHGASERRARPARPEGRRCGRHAGRDARRARPARRKPAGRRRAEFLDHLPGRSSALGAEGRKENRVRSLSRRSCGARDQDGRPEAGDGEGPRGRRGLSHARHPLDRALGGARVQRHRRGRRSSGLAARSRDVDSGRQPSARAATSHGSSGSRTR